MGVAEAVLSQDGKRIDVHTRLQGGSRGHSFDEMLAMVKRVPGARFRGADKVWHYPLAIDTCLALRGVFGKDLRVGADLSQWYREHAAQADAHRTLAAAGDAPLTAVPAAFSAWLRPYQRAGAKWVAQAYRNAGLVADTPGVGKTSETIAGLVEAGITGPVLVTCPRPSVRLVWGKELAQHLPDVPTYLCYGTRARREKVIAQFAADMKADPTRLRVVVVVAEMLRVELGDPCYTKGDTKVAGFCPQRWKSGDWSCALHLSARVGKATELELEDPKRRTKDQVPVGFSFPELFDAHMLGGGWSAIILDESHKLLGSLTVAKGNLMAKGLRYLPERADVTRRYALSGTPFGKGGRVQGMFGTLHWLWPDEYTSFWRWALAHFEVVERVINRRGNTAKEIKGLKGVSWDASEEERVAAMERFLQTLGPRILRRTKAEVLPDLKPKEYYEVVCEMTAPQRKQYQQLADFAEVTTQGGPIVPNGGLAVLTRERQIANGEIITGRGGKVQFTGVSGKIERLWEKLEAHGILDGAPGTKIVVASEFNEFLDVVQEKLLEDRVPHFRLDGSTPDARRDLMVQCWQEDLPVPRDRSVSTQKNRDTRRHTAQPGDRPRVFLVNSVAAGISITLDAADEMHILDERWNPEENEQLEDRIHRASNLEHKVSIWYYRTEGTIDYEKAHSVEMKRRAQHAVLDGNRGVQYIREMMVDSLSAVEEE